MAKFSVFWKRLREQCNFPHGMICVAVHHVIGHVSKTVKQCIAW